MDMACRASMASLTPLRRRRMTSEEQYWEWGSDAEKPRLLHSMIRVASLDRALDFYCAKLGMNLLSRVDIEAGKFSIAFVSFGDDYYSGAIELTYNWDHFSNTSGYTHGNGYGHIAIGVPDLAGTCDRLAAQGVEIKTPPKRLLPTAPALAFIKDPDGYQIELIQTSRRYPIPEL
jgi:lactoylglutathione lyase